MISWLRSSLAFVAFASLTTQSSYALTCQNVKQIISTYLQSHYSMNDFTPEISRRAIDSYAKAWDPGKVYFLKADIEEFAKTYETQLPLLLARADCSAIDGIYARYTKRFEERQAMLPKMVAAPQNFKLDEYLNLDRKALDWGKNAAELDERWRLRVKYQFKQLLEVAESEPKTREKLLKKFQLMGKRQKELTTDDVYGMFLDSFSISLDPHTSYFSPTQLEDFHIATRLSLEGIGALLRSEDGFTKIQSLVPGGAAFKTKKIKVEDVIIAVAQGTAPPVNVIDMDLRDVVKMVRGARGTTVNLTVKRKSEVFVVPIKRERIQLADHAAKSKVHEVIPKDGKGSPIRVGVIDLPSFYMDLEGRQAHTKNFKSSSDDVRREVENLKRQKVDSIVLDLRSNGGGILDEAIDIAGLFTGPGPIVLQKGARTKPFASLYRNKSIYDGPLEVLIDRQSASASEILAGAIKDYDRGLIVGSSHSFGKGTVQHLNDLAADMGAIKVTIYKFYLPSGESTQLRGVETHLTLPSLFDHYEIGEKYYDYALPFDTVPMADHKNFGLVEPYLPKLKEASLARIKVEEGFKKIDEAIKTYEGKQDERYRVSLKYDPKAAKEEKKKALAEANKAKQDKKAKGKNAKVERDFESPKETADSLDGLKDPEFQQEEEDLESDVHLKEAIHIAADYARLLRKEPLAMMEIAAPAKPKPALEKSQASSQ